MSTKEQYVQSKVETEKPVILESLTKLYEQYGLDFQEEYLNLVRKYNEAGVLELLPESEELGIIDRNGEELSLISVNELAKKLEPWLKRRGYIGSSSDGGDMDDRKQRRGILDLQGLIFISEYIQYSPARITVRDRFLEYNKNGNNPDDLVVLLESTPPVFIFDVLRNLKFHELVDNINKYSSEIQSRVALNLIDSGKIDYFYSHLEYFHGLSEEVVEAMTRKGKWIEQEDRDYFNQNVDWDALEKKYY